MDGTGDGDTSPDWEVIDAHHVLLRAERAGNGSGRIYTITVTVTFGGIEFQQFGDCQGTAFAITGQRECDEEW